MKTLSKEQVLMLHARLIEATGGSDGIRDERECLILPLPILFNRLAEKNYTQVFRQRQHNFVLGWWKIMR